MGNNLLAWPLPNLLYLNFFLHLLQGFVTLSKYFKWMNITSTTKLLLFFHLKCVIATLKPVFFWLPAFTIEFPDSQPILTQFPEFYRISSLVDTLNYNFLVPHT